MATKKESFDFVKNEQNLTAYGIYYPYEKGNFGSTDTSYPEIAAYFEILNVIWHKEWGGNIVDIDVTDLMEADEIFDIQENYCKNN